MLKSILGCFDMILLLTSIAPKA